MSSDTTRTDNKVQELRDSAGLSQEQLAKKSGIARATISSIETGRMVPSGETAKKIVTALNRELKTKLRNWEVFPGVFKDPAAIVGKKESVDD